MESNGAKSRLLKNFGVTGPVDLNRRLLTQAFVHRQHLRIFPNFYPIWFRNWYNDDWLQLVYAPFNRPVSGTPPNESPALLRASLPSLLTWSNGACRQR